MVSREVYLRQTKRAGMLNSHDTVMKTSFNCTVHENVDSSRESEAKQWWLIKACFGVDSNPLTPDDNCVLAVTSFFTEYLRSLKQVFSDRIKIVVLIT